MKKILPLAALCAALVLFCIFVIDRPVERFVAAHQGTRFLFQLCATPSLLPLPLACIYLALVAVRRISGAAPLHPTALAASLATMGAVAAKDELKWMFGRPWPTSWIKYHLYNFQPFSNNFLYGSFPSGHTSYIAAPMCVLWMMLPHYRWLWGGLILLVMLGLVAAGYHYIGDVIGGFFNGLAAAAITLALLRPARHANG